MADSGILKEFLVALGFKVDEKKLKDFTQGIDNASKMVGKFALGLEAMATAAEVAVVKVSTQFENLYYASQRLGDTVEDIRGFSFAMGQVGSTGKAGLQAMENVGEFLRSNPGGNRLFQAWGIDLKYVNGQAQVTSQTMEQLGATFRKMPYFQAKQYAAVLGIDPSALQAMLRGTGEAQSRASEIFKRMGVDQDAAALASKNFMNDFREMGLVLTVSLDRIILAVQPTFDAITRGLENMDKATGGWSTALIVLGGLLLPLLAVVDPLVIGIAALAAAIAYVGSKSGAFDELAAAGKNFADAIPPEFWSFLLKSVQAIGQVLSDVVVTALHLITGQLNVAADLVRLISDLLHGNWSAAWKDAAKIAADSIGMIKRAWKDTGKAMGDAWNPDSFTGKGGGKPSAKPSNDNGVQAGLKTGANVAANVAAKIQGFFAAHGFSAAQARGMAAGAYAEGGLTGKSNPTSGAFGIGQWLGKRKAELFKRYGSNPTIDQQLEFMLSELSGSESGAGSIIKRQGSERGALSAYVQKFMRPGDGTAGDLQRGMTYLNGAPPLTSGAAANGNKDVNLTQNTHITVTGSDPATTSKLVTGEQGRVNDALARNLKVAAS